jgi:hypothetical protein
MTSGLSYGALVTERARIMRLARNAAFYMRSASRPGAHNQWRKLVQQRVREARTIQRLVIARRREMTADHAAMRDGINAICRSRGPAAYF